MLQAIGKPFANRLSVRDRKIEADTMRRPRVSGDAISEATEPGQAVEVMAAPLKDPSQSAVRGSPASKKTRFRDSDKLDRQARQSACTNACQQQDNARKRSRRGEWTGAAEQQSSGAEGQPRLFCTDKLRALAPHSERYTLPSRPGNTETHRSACFEQGSTEGNQIRGPCVGCWVRIIQHY